MPHLRLRRVPVSDMDECQPGIEDIENAAASRPSAGRFLYAAFFSAARRATVRCRGRAFQPHISVLNLLLRADMCVDVILGKNNVMLTDSPHNPDFQSGVVVMAKVPRHRCVQVPFEALSTSKTLAWLVSELPTPQLENLIGRLIDDLNHRHVDCDLEIEELE
jgi:hypothetical protein